MPNASVGLVFADISGTTRLYGKIGTAEAQHALERCVKRMERSIEGCSGTILMPAADEMVASFASADEAVQAAIEMQFRIADLPPVSGVKLSIRIGVNFGTLDTSGQDFDGPMIDIGRSLLNLAGPNQILVCGVMAELLSAPLRENLHLMQGVAINTPAGECVIYSVEWQNPVKGSSTAAVGASPAVVEGAHEPMTRLCVRFGGKSYLLDERSPSLSIGRDKKCDIVIADRKASREHARFEKRGRGKFYLVDSSTNGTYVRLEGQNEAVVRGEEVLLGGLGQVAFGHSTSSAEASVADFEMM